MLYLIKVNEEENFMKVLKKGYTEITVKRPDGTTETVTKTDHITDYIFNQMKVKTAEAGRGTLLTWKWVEAVIEREESDYIVKCEHCGHTLDSRTAYHQFENYCGNKVITYYCNDCHSLLSAVGMGELSALEAKTTETVTTEPFTKED